MSCSNKGNRPVLKTEQVLLRGSTAESRHAFHSLTNEATTAAKNGENFPEPTTEEYLALLDKKAMQLRADTGTPRISAKTRDERLAEIEEVKGLVQSGSEPLPSPVNWHGLQNLGGQIEAKRMIKAARAARKDQQAAAQAAAADAADSAPAAPSGERLLPRAFHTQVRCGEHAEGAFSQDENGKLQCSEGGQCAEWSDLQEGDGRLVVNPADNGVYVVDGPTSGNCGTCGQYQGYDHSCAVSSERLPEMSAGTAQAMEGLSVPPAELASRGGMYENLARRMPQERIAAQAEELGASIHEEWRAGRKQADGTYEKRDKNLADGSTFDIANASFSDLPEQYRTENYVAGLSALAAASAEHDAGDSISEQQAVERIAGTVHEQWLQRNGSWAPPEQQLPYSAPEGEPQLTETEREKDRVLARRAWQAVQVDR